MQIVRVENNGANPLVVTDVDLQDPNSRFEIGRPPLPQTVAAGATLDLPILFAPMGVAARYAATIAITTNAPDARWFRVVLSGDGVEMGFTCDPFDLRFPERLVGDGQGLQAVSITNVGARPLSAPTLTLQGRDPQHFALLEPMPSALQPGEQVQVPVVYRPHAAGSHDATVVVRGPGLAVTSLRLFGVAAKRPALAAVPPGLELGAVPVGTPSASMTVTLQPDAAVSWLPHVTRITASDPAILVARHDPEFPRSHPLVLDVVLAPTRAGTLTGTIAVTYDGPIGGTLTIPVSGEGVAVQVTPPRAGCAVGPLGAASQTPLVTLALMLAALLASGRREPRTRRRRVLVAMLVVPASMSVACRQAPDEADGGGFTCTPSCGAGYRCTADGCRGLSDHDLGDYGPRDLLSSFARNPCQEPVAVATDGGCGQCRVDGECPDGMVCTPSSGVGECVPGCHDDGRCGAGLPGQTLRCCDGRCRDVSAFDIGNCGGCGMACSRPPNRDATCQQGKCIAGACLAGWADCNQQSGDGCEIHIDIDLEHCTKCNQRCALANARAACAAGCYIASCTIGFDDCNGVAGDGCETDLNSDRANCGACGNKCGLKMLCVAGQCV